MQSISHEDADQGCVLEIPVVLDLMAVKRGTELDMPFRLSEILIKRGHPCFAVSIQEFI